MIGPKTKEEMLGKSEDQKYWDEKLKNGYKVNRNSYLRYRNSGEGINLYQEKIYDKDDMDIQEKYDLYGTF